jgi:TolB protein
MRRALLLLLCVSALAALPAHGTAPGKNGQIVYARFPTLWVIDPDGSGKRKLPHVKRSEAHNPDWSPDGSRLAFERCASNCEIWTTTAGGTQAKRLSPDCLRRADAACIDRGTPAWAPDGKRIAFGQGSKAIRNGTLKFSEIYVMNADGSVVRQVTHITVGKPFAMEVNRPMWSPDGKQLVFEVQNFRIADPPNRRALFVVDADGSNLRQLTEWSLNGGDHRDWSPDGKLILFRAVSTGNRHHGNLYTIHPDGSGLTRLTNYPAPRTVLSGSYSPDGRWITFSRYSGDSPYPAVFVMRANGADLRRVTRDSAAYEPDWGPTR